MEEYTGGASMGFGEWAMVGSGYILAFGKMAWDRFFSKEGKANDLLVAQLTQRLDSQENEVKAMKAEVDRLRRLWHYEQDKVHRLVLYVLDLKAELRRHGIEVPASGALYSDTDLAALLGINEDKEQEGDNGSVAESDSNDGSE